MKNDKYKLFRAAKSVFFDSFENADLIGEFILGSDILDLRTVKSDLDLLFLYKNKAKNFSSYNPSLKHCSRFLVVDGMMIQWRALSILEAKNELHETDRNKKDFSLLASFAKMGLDKATIEIISCFDSRFIQKIWANRKKISICASYSFLDSEKVAGSCNVEKAFESERMSAASSVNPKFWYTAFLGYNLLFGGSYNIELVKELKDFTYGQETILIKENEQDIINKVKLCYEYYERNFPNGVDNLIDSVYNDIVKENKEETLWHPVSL